MKPYINEHGVLNIIRYLHNIALHSSIIQIIISLIVGV